MIEGSRNITFTAGIGNLVYAPTELLMASQTVGVTAFVVGWAVAALFYFTRVSRWMASDQGGVQRRIAVE